MSTPTLRPERGSRAGIFFGAAIMLWIFLIALPMLGSVWLAVALVGFFVTLATGILFALSRM